MVPPIINAIARTINIIYAAPKRRLHKHRADCLRQCPEGCEVEGRAQVPAKVPAKLRVGCVGKIGCRCALKSAREDNMWLCAFGPHAVGLVEIWVPFHTCGSECMLGRGTTGTLYGPIHAFCWAWSVILACTFTSVIRVFFFGRRPSCTGACAFRVLCSETSVSS